MVMPINSLMVSEGPAIYYEPAFRLMIETHLGYLRSLPTNRVIDIEPHDAYKYEGDLDGLLRKHSVPHHLHWIIMRLNDIDSPTQFTGDITKLMIVSEENIKSLTAVYRTANKKIA